MGAPDLVSIGSGPLSATFNLRGAELWSLRVDGEERLWNGDPAWWDYRAPLLFPVVGRSIGETITIGGQPFPMPLHGFARDLPFTLAAADPDRIALVQEADAGTRAMFPFDYRLRVDAWVDGPTLGMAVTVTNASPGPMPFCLGYHPGFLWAETAQARQEFVCRFERPETAPVRRARPDTGLLIAGGEASPVDGRTMALHDDLFVRGSIQFDRLLSRAVWFGRPGTRGLAVAFPRSPQLGIWTRAGAPFLCIEPWQGLAAEEGGSAELARRPGADVLAPGAEATFPLTVTAGVMDPGA